MVDEVPLKWLAASLDNRMADFCKKENLREIKPGHPEYNSFHKGCRKYIDIATGYRFINHFSDAMPEDLSYEQGIARIKRRIARLFDSFDKYSRFLMVLGTRFPIGNETLLDLKRVLESRYSGKVFDIDVLEFNADKQETVRVSDGIITRRIVRDWNAYDTEGRNFEWSFLDEVESSIKPKTKGKVSFHVWPHVKCIIQFHRT
jgi:hypothetical protein